MKRKDIVRGQKYKNNNVPGFTFWGVERALKLGSTGKKYLVIIDGDSCDLGKIVQKPKLCAPGYWNEFYPI